MKLTKFQHACLVLEKDDTTLVIDPGRLAHDFIPPRRVDAIIITHEHDDHFDEAQVLKLLQAHPKAVVMGHQTITGRFTNFQTIAAQLGQNYSIGSFNVQFFGGSHAAIAEGIAPIPNFGVLIDNRLYYPGDSFSLPPQDVTVEALALPISAPWLKISEATAFLAQVKPAFAFPTHDGLLSTDGKQVTDRLVGIVASQQSTEYKRLDGLRIEL